MTNSDTFLNDSKMSELRYFAIDGEYSGTIKIYKISVDHKPIIN